MRTYSALRRSAVLLLALGLIAGGDCSIDGVIVPSPNPPIVADFVEIELVNTTVASVDAGIFVDGVEQIIDPPVAAGETIVFDADCFVGTIVESDAVLLTGFGALPSDNVPFLVEGEDFFCGDLISFLYAEDAEGFFTDVEIIAGF